MGTPHRVCRTFARLDFILVPLPAAKITAKIGELSDMYPHHSYRSSTRRSPAALLGWGGRIRTCDPGTKTRCLATWLRPSTGPRRLYRSAFSPSGTGSATSRTSSRGRACPRNAATPCSWATPAVPTTPGSSSTSSTRNSGTRTPSKAGKPFASSFPKSWFAKPRLRRRGAATGTRSARILVRAILRRAHGQVQEDKGRGHRERRTEPERAPERPQGGGTHDASDTEEDEGRREALRRPLVEDRRAPYGEQSAHEHHPRPVEHRRGAHGHQRSRQHAEQACAGPEAEKREPKGRPQAHTVHKVAR